MYSYPYNVASLATLTVYLDLFNNKNYRMQFEIKKNIYLSI